MNVKLVTLESVAEDVDALELVNGKGAILQLPN